MVGIDTPTFELLSRPSPMDRSSEAELTRETTVGANGFVFLPSLGAEDVMEGEEITEETGEGFIETDDGFQED